MTQTEEPMTKKQAAWNAESYHEVSRPHATWAERVLARVPTAGIDSAVDAGCGTGKITRELLDLLPDATITALDYSDTMLEVAERELRPLYGDRVRFVQADLAALTPETIGGPVDLVFSTATFHWVADHDDLMRRLFAVLSPGGWLIAQCGGGPNLKRFRERTFALHASPGFAEWYVDWHEPWTFADDVETAARLTAAGFTEIETGLEYHPAVMADAAAYSEFIRTVILREHLRPLPSDELEERYVQSLTEQAARDDPPFELDYWRLNMNAHRPG